jgi:hypothetical protein
VVGRERSTQKINKLRTKKKYFKKKGFGTAHPPNWGGAAAVGSWPADLLSQQVRVDFFYKKKYFFTAKGR